MSDDNFTPLDPDETAAWKLPKSGASNATATDDGPRPRSAREEQIYNSAKKITEQARKVEWGTGFTERTAIAIGLALAALLFVLGKSAATTPLVILVILYVYAQRRSELMTGNLLKGCIAAVVVIDMILAGEFTTASGLSKIVSLLACAFAIFLTGQAAYRLSPRRK